MPWGYGGKPLSQYTDDELDEALRRLVNLKPQPFDATRRPARGEQLEDDARRRQRFTRWIREEKTRRELMRRQREPT